MRTDLPRQNGRQSCLQSPARSAAFPLPVRQTADRPRAALHAPALPFRNSLPAGRAVEELDPAFVVAVLNGPVAASAHRAARAEAPALHDALAAAVRAPRPGTAGSAPAIAAPGARVVAADGLPPEALAEMRRAVGGASA